MPNMTEEEKARRAAEDKMRTVDFQVDTVSVDAAAGAAAYYRSGSNTITSNYEIEDDESGHKYNQSSETLTHEQKHRDNYLQGFYAYAVSPEQAYKRNMHDEISATMTELISLREEYIRTGDINVFDRIPKLSFYKEAIEKGEINPKSQYKEDFDKDMRFIVNGTQKMWVEEYGRDFYIDNCLWEYANRGDHEGKYAAYWDQNYQNSLKIAYNIGGVDFTQYMEKDVEIPREAYDKIVQEVLKNPSKQEYYHMTDEQVFAKSGFTPYDGSISLEQYKQLLQHQMAINDFAGGRSTILKDGSVKNYTPQEYMQSLTSPETIAWYKKFYNDATDINNPGSDKIRKEFPTFDDYLRFMRSGEAKTFKEKLILATIHGDFVDKMVEYQAQKYAKTGKEFPQADNQENYQKALNKIYGDTYDFMHPDEVILNKNLSAKTQQIRADSRKNWLDKARDKMRNIKHRLTHIKDEKGEEHNVGLWQKLKHKAKEITMKKGILKRDKTPTDVVKNEPTHPVNKQAPEYRQWKNEDGSRVSEVQHRKILDMNKPIIRQPTRSYAKEQLPPVVPDNLRVTPISQNGVSPRKADTIAKMKGDSAQSKAETKPKVAKFYPNKSALITMMRQDAAKARQATAQKTKTKKIARLHGKNTFDKFFKDLAEKVSDR